MVNNKGEISISFKQEAAFFIYLGIFNDVSAYLPYVFVSPIVVDSSHNDVVSLSKEYIGVNRQHLLD